MNETAHGTAAIIFTNNEIISNKGNRSSRIRNMHTHIPYKS